MFTAQHILQGVSDLPEDRFVNTFHFQPDGVTPLDHAQAADAIAARLQEFYDTTVSTAYGLQSVASFLSDQVSTSVEVRVYNNEDPEPREPETRTYTLTNLSAGVGFPTEVALCLSYYANRNLPRYRGRVYIGPLKQSAGGAAAGETNRPAPTILDCLVKAGARLAGSGDGLYWSTLSRATVGVLTYSRITDLWVDNAWDTQRRRGIAPSSRVTAEAPPA